MSLVESKVRFQGTPRGARPQEERTMKSLKITFIGATFATAGLFLLALAALGVLCVLGLGMAAAACNLELANQAGRAGVTFLC